MSSMTSSSGGSSAKSGTSSMKRADKRSSITIWVLGDEGVGKSSLISTFVSRYFSEVVPGIMTRVRLPPNPENSCVTTIIDSQGGDSALLSAVAAMSLGRASAGSSTDSLTKLMEQAESSMQQQQQPSSSAASASETGAGTTAESVLRASTSSATSAAAGIDKIDSIVLVYDLDRAETFFRLENHWLPLIERYYNGKVPVIVAENKMDLFRPSSSASMTDEQALARKRQQIVSLMQRFPFIRQCIKCSAKNLLRVEDVFNKAQQAVLYPFTPPLYDLQTGTLTVECKRAFTRIFRMYDHDHDGLLSDPELDHFQRATYHVAVFEKDFAAWKKVVTRNNPNTDEVVIQDGKFTIPGFLAIFDVFISQNRLDVVWQALRTYGYDDDLNLHVPDYVTNPTDDVHLAKSWKLSSSAKKFLAAVFHQFDSDKDGVLSPDDVAAIFSILPPPAFPPWHPARSPKLFEGSFSFPKEVPADYIDSSRFGDSLIVPGSMSQTLSNSGLSILSVSDSLPSVDVSMLSASKPLSFLQWMGHWHAMSAISPAVTRAELFRLGHVERTERRKQPSSRREHRKKVAPAVADDDSTLDSREIRVLVLGSQRTGKTALLNALCGTFDGTDVKATDTTPTMRPETCSTFVKLKRSFPSNGGGGSGDEDLEDVVVHLVFTDVPETAAASQEEHYRELTELFGSTTSPKDRVCDLALLVFDCSRASSLSYAKELESTLLTNETPRVFVGTKADLRRPPEPDDGDAHPATVVDSAEVHCQESDLEAPLLVSAVDSSESMIRNDALIHLAQCALTEPGIPHLRSRPHEEEKRREAAKRRKLMWIGGICVGVVVAVGVGLLFGTSGKKDKRSVGLTSWLRSWFPSSSTKKPSTS